ncbi:MAG: hypothetical protein E6H05_01940 [Bacillati bacterium ANGP1]|uniref:Fibronectin type-III domain-containing protein n=1 Tax=Candidatus Segetimicrobium genomatis TaxID=2569760 RepID=A0A537J0A3_9BACT|nr:MAG: hypothetical protein E6H05_01940 [Terrabacteria group bacterium ANGP1]
MFLAVRNGFARSVLVTFLTCMFLFQPLGSIDVLAPSPVFAQSIPYLSQWETNMRTYGSLHCVLGTLDQVYYDAERVYYQIADYTGDPSWLNCSQLAETVYRDQYVLPNNGSVPGHWNFTTGLRLDAQRTADAQSKTAAVLLSQHAAFATDGTPLAWTQSADYSREVAYAVVSYIDAQALGEPLRQRRIDLVTQAYDHMAQWFVRFAWPGPWQQSPQETIRLAPFMVGLTAHTLIRDWEQTKDSRLIPTLRLAADWMWANAWIPSTQAMWYEFPDQGQPCCQASGPAPDLNLLIAPIYAFLYRQTGETKYRDEGDAIFAGGVAQAWLGGGKQFDQNYWWSFDYVTWRSAVPAAADAIAPAVAITAPASGSTVSGASVTVSATASDNVGVVGVQFTLDGTNLGTEDTTAPYAIIWSTTMVPNGAHTLTAVARDAAGNRTISAAVGVTVSNTVADTMPPVISSVTAVSVTSSGAIITWTTNEPADSQVEYGRNINYGIVTPLDTRLVTVHSVMLIGLAARTPYHYRVKSKDTAGNLTKSADFTFKTTSSTADATRPPIALTAPMPAMTIISGTVTVFGNGGILA